MSWSIENQTIVLWYFLQNNSMTSQNLHKKKLATSRLHKVRILIKIPLLKTFLLPAEWEQRRSSLLSQGERFFSGKTIKWSLPETRLIKIFKGGRKERVGVVIKSLWETFSFYVQYWRIMNMRAPWLSAIKGKFIQALLKFKTIWARKEVDKAHNLNFLRHWFKNSRNFFNKHKSDIIGLSEVMKGENFFLPPCRFSFGFVIKKSLRVKKCLGC